MLRQSRGNIVPEQPVVLPISTAKELINFVHAINKLHNKQQRDLVVTLTNDIDIFN